MMRTLQIEGGCYKVKVFYPGIEFIVCCVISIDCLHITLKVEIIYTLKKFYYELLSSDSITFQYNSVVA